jgi:hypothetical protein
MPTTTFEINHSGYGTGPHTNRKIEQTKEIDILTTIFLYYSKNTEK